MKMRVGFVSNSSTSSFVIIGYGREAINKSTVDRKSLLKRDKELRLLGNESELEINQLWDEYFRDSAGQDNLFGIKNITSLYVADDDGFYVGAVISNMSSDDCEKREPLSQLNKYIESAKELQKVLGLKEEPKVISGTRSC